MRALLITTEDRRAVDNLVANAGKPENWYDPSDRSEGWMDRLPGNRDGHTYKLFDGFRCVYSVTKAKNERRYRHLSISVTGEAYPSPHAVLEIGRLFGFTGDGPADPERVLPDEWMVHANPGDQFSDQHIVIAQELPA